MTINGYIINVTLMIITFQFHKYLSNYIFGILLSLSLHVWYAYIEGTRNKDIFKILPFVLTQTKKAQTINWLNAHKYLTIIQSLVLIFEPHKKFSLYTYPCWCYHYYHHLNKRWYMIIYNVWLYICV